MFLAKNSYAVFAYSTTLIIDLIRVVKCGYLLKISLSAFAGKNFTF